MGNSWTKVPVLSNRSTLPVPASAVHTLPFPSTATPPRPEKWPCVAVVPSIVNTGLPDALNFMTTLLPASPTYTEPFDLPLELSTATLVGFWNWPGPAPGMPAWHPFLFVHTSLFAWPSLTPHPQAALKTPFSLKRWTRAFALSATYTLPPPAATPIGVWNCPASVPGAPKAPTWTMNATSVWNVVSAPVTVPSAFTATARK